MPNNQSSIYPKPVKVEPKVEFQRDEYILLTLPYGQANGFIEHPRRVNIDDAIKLASQLADALEEAGYGPSKCNPDCHA